MKTQEKKPETVSRTLQRQESKAQQPSAGIILQAYREGIVQRAIEDEEEPLQMKRNNETGLPDQLKSGIEALSGYSMDDVRVHYNSSQPTQFQALAYTQGSNIHVAPGQEKHLAHEAWHVVQQKQGRVQPTMQMKGVNVNDDQGLEREADEMGGRAANIIQNKQQNQPIYVSNSLSHSYQFLRKGRAVHLGKNKRNYTIFKGTTFEKEYTKDNGHFFSRYEPANKRLIITLKVNYPTGIGASLLFNHPSLGTAKRNDAFGVNQIQKDLFKNTVENTWSGKYSIKTNVKNASLLSINNWKELNPIAVSIRVIESNSTDAFFKIVSNPSFDSSWVWKVNGGLVTLATGAYWETLKSLGKPGLPNHNQLREYNIYAHEAGHMLGLDDEYANGTLGQGMPTKDFKLADKALGNDYAKKYAVIQSDSKIKDTLMGAGKDVRKHHYVTFWDALIQSIKEKTTENDKAPRLDSDWEIE